MRPRRFDPKRDYPLGCKRPDLVKTTFGISFQDISLKNIVSGRIRANQIRMRSKTLELQAQIAEAHGRSQMAVNFRRAAELISIPDNEVLRIYNALRPRRSTKEELLGIARELEERYQAHNNAGLIREAVEIYEKRGLLKIEG